MKYNKAIFILSILLVPLCLSAQVQNIQRLADELQSPEQGVRRKAAIGLARVGTTQSVLLLRNAFETEVSIAIRLEIVKAMRNIAFLRYPGYREALVALGEASSDAVEPEAQIRLRATQALWEAGERDLLNPVPFLERTLQDESQRLRITAVNMLRKLGTPETIDPLAGAALDKAQPEAIRLKAIDALGAVSLRRRSDGARDRSVKPECSQSTGFYASRRPETVVASTRKPNPPPRRRAPG